MQIEKAQYVINICNIYILICIEEILNLCFRDPGLLENTIFLAVR